MIFENSKELEAWCCSNDISWCKYNDLCFNATSWEGAFLNIQNYYFLLNIPL